MIIFVLAFVLISIGAINESPFAALFGIIVLFAKPINEIWNSLFDRAKSSIIIDFMKQLEGDLPQVEYERIIKKVVDSTYPNRIKHNFLAKLIKDNPFPEVKPYTGIQLAKLTDYTDKRAIDGLLITISDSKFHRRADTIVKSIHKYGKAVEEPLIAMLDHNSTHARQHAAIALSNLKSRKAVPKLIERLNILSDNSVHHYIIDALVQIDAKESIEIIRHFLVNETTDTVLSALKAVAYFRDKDSIETAFDLLNHNHPPIQIQALETILM